MTDKDKENLNEIIDEIFRLDRPKIDDERKPSIADLIKTTVNGDTIGGHLVINSSLKEDKPGATAYFLTDRRVIKIAIADKEAESLSYPLNRITGVHRKLTDTDRASVNVILPEDSFGLDYPMTYHEITDFFKKIDQAILEGDHE